MFPYAVNYIGQDKIPASRFNRLHCLSIGSLAHLSEALFRAWAWLFRTIH